MVNKQMSARATAGWQSTGKLRTMCAIADKGVVMYGRDMFARWAGALHGQTVEVGQCRVSGRLEY